MFVFSPKGIPHVAQGCDALRGATRGTRHTPLRHIPNGVAAVWLEALRHDFDARGVAELAEEFFAVFPSKPEGAHVGNAEPGNDV